MTESVVDIYQDEQQDTPILPFVKKSNRNVLTVISPDE